MCRRGSATMRPLVRLTRAVYFRSIANIRSASSSRRSDFRLLVVILLVALTSASTSNAQYDWSPHLGEQLTGFEKYWFGKWDLEVRSLKGMIDWKHYSDPIKSDVGLVSRINREAMRRSAADSTESVVHRSQSIVRSDGRVSSTTYLDPKTGKTLQRELFRYDDDGRLVEWRPVRDPSDVSYASIARTLFVGTLPAGRSQHFSYYADGTLKNWHACGVTGPGADSCSDTSLEFSPAGKLVAFSWLKNDYHLKRDASGRLVRVEIVNGVNGYRQVMEMQFDDVIIRERFVDSLNVGRENTVAKGMNGSILQYRVPSSAGSMQYSTTTWTYDSSGNISEIQKGLEHYLFERDKSGLVTMIQQSSAGPNLFRAFDENGVLISQTPALEYNRFDLVENGSEAFTYRDDGLLSNITVNSEIADSIARLDIEYEFRRKLRAPTRKTDARDR